MSGAEKRSRPPASASGTRETGPAEASPADTSVNVPPEEQTFYCDLCGNVMLNLHCKLICEHCGYERDCSDP